ncbi:MAG: MopE-related protein, partial [Myxococcota bacterium]
MHPPSAKPRSSRSRALDWRSPFRAWVVVATACVGCGELGCPDGFANASGVCAPAAADTPMQPEPEPEPEAPAEDPDDPRDEPMERCDGVDNDGDTEIDEDFPELGTPCGDGLDEGECEAGEYACRPDGTGTECVGAVGPTAEVCDGLDNDCDGTTDNGPPETCDGVDNDCNGLIDEGVLSVKAEALSAGIATVASVSGGFGVTRVLNGQIRIETYDTTGTRTGSADDLALELGLEPEFIDSDGLGDTVHVIWGEREVFAASVTVDTSLIPVIFDSLELHPEWEVNEVLPTTIPPYHPRVSAAAKRIVGYPDLQMFALANFDDGLSSLATKPVQVTAFPAYTVFDARSAWVVREDGENLRASILLDDGGLRFDIDIGRGSDPSAHDAIGALGVASILGDELQITELNGLSLQCIQDRYCSERIGLDDLAAPARGPTSLVYEAARDLWWVVFGRLVVALGRQHDRPVVQHLTERGDV